MTETHEHFQPLTKAPTGTTEALITQQKCCISGFRADCGWMAAKAGQMVRYPVTLAPDDNDTILVTFPDFPEAHTFGDDESEALARAVDALETIIDAYIRDKRDVPAPSMVRGLSVRLPSLVAAKVQIYNQMRQQRVGKAELARRLGAHLPLARRRPARSATSRV